MKKLQKLLSVLLCLCMMTGAAAFAEEAEVSAVIDIPADAVLVTVNGEDVTWEKVRVAYEALASQYASYYDLSQQENVDLFRAVALENIILEVLMAQKAVEFGVSELTAEEIAAVEETASTEWEGAIDYYISANRPDITEESSDEDKAAARAEAEAYYQESTGFTAEGLAEDYKRYEVLLKVQDLMVQDAVVTDEEVEAFYQAQVAEDKEMYGSDLAAYMEYEQNAQMMAYYASMYGTASEYDKLWYRPEGFRAVKHILLPVDEELMTAYTDLQARLEEQASAEEGAEEGAEGEEAAEPVTEEMVNEAKAAIFASLADKIDEINQKVAEGADFDALIAEYGVDAEGNPSDPGMVSGDSAVNGYDVCEYSGAIYVTEFVDAAMSLEKVGDVSAPYLSSFGIHIVKYIADIPGGPIEMTEAEREAKRAELLYEKQNELYNAALDNWLAEAEVTYSGVVPSYAELEAAAAADAAAETAE